MRARAVMGMAVLAMAAGACSSVDRPVVVGAIYPIGGPQGPGGLEEYRGVELAAELANRDGGIGGRPIRLELREVNAAEGAPAAVRELAGMDVQVILGTYGSTISEPAAVTAAREDIVFWETGAVGMVPASVEGGDRFFRIAPTGGSLGAAAVSFVRRELLPRKGLDPGGLRFSVAFVDDVYGRSVGEGALREIEDSVLTLAGSFPYGLGERDWAGLADRIAGAGTDVLVVGAYLEDGVALRRAVVSAGVPLVASIGTSSSYCMPEFGRILGSDAVGLFASDKPDGDVVDPNQLRPEAAAALRWARDEYRARFGAAMPAPTLAGFAAAWALFHHVLPGAGDLSPDAIAAAARRTMLPEGALPNGSGLAFGGPATAAAGTNLRAASVIWEWIRPNTRAVVWPPAFATAPIALIAPGS